MTEETSSFVRTSIALARAHLPYGDCVAYLRELAISLDTYQEPLALVRATIASLTESDAQLQLIATGQMRLDFQATPGRAIKPSRVRVARRKTSKR